MAQSTLHPGTGTHYAKDTLAIKLLNLADVNADGQGSWVEVRWPTMGKPVQAELTCAAVTGTSVEANFILEAADDGSGNGLVAVGGFDVIDENDDNATRRLVVGPVRKRYMRVKYLVAGTTPVVNDVTVTLRPADYKLDDGRTA